MYCSDVLLVKTCFRNMALLRLMVCTMNAMIIKTKTTAGIMLLMVLLVSPAQ